MKNIKIIADDIVISATLNDKIAEKKGKFDLSQKQNGWKNGDISLADGWLALLYGGEKQSASYSSMMIIGKIEEKYLPTVASFGSSVNITVEEV